MSREILQEMVSAIRRLRGKPIDSDRVEEWAARLEAHLVELEFLAAQAVPDAVEPGVSGPLAGSHRRSQLANCMR